MKESRVNPRPNPNSPQKDMLQALRDKLQVNEQELQNVRRDRDELKEVS